MKGTFSNYGSFAGGFQSHGAYVRAALAANPGRSGRPGGYRHH